MTSTPEVKYDFEPWDGVPGTAFDSYDTRLMNYGSKSARDGGPTARTDGDDGDG